MSHHYNFMLSVWLVACASSSPPGAAPNTASDAEQAPASEAEQCLADATAPREQVPSAPDKIGVAHILVRHAGLERPQGAERSRAEACLRALEALEALQGGSGWDEAVDTYSDAPGATHGDLGRVARDDVRPRFANAAFALEVDQLSYVVETDAGFHIILRTE